MSNPVQPGTDRPRRLDARRNHDQILVIANAAIEQFGAEASLRDIARKAGIGLGTLYRHFPSREALIEALMRERLDTFSKRVRAARSLADPGAALEACILEYLAGVMVYKGIACSFMGAFQDPTSALHAACAAAQEELDALLRMAQAAGQVRPDVSVKDLLALVNGLAWVFDQGTHAPEQRTILVQVVIAGLRFQRSPSPTAPDRLPGSSHAT